MTQTPKKKPGRKANFVELSEEFIRNAAIPRDAASRTLHGQDGLFFRMERFKQRKILGVTYNIKGARRETKQMVLGHYPEISFEEAREKALKVRAAAAEGLDPKSATAGLKTGQGWRDKIQQETPPQIYESDPDRKRGNVPYMVAYQQGGMRHLVYVNDRSSLFEILDAENLGAERKMTQGEAREAVAYIRRTLPPNDLKRIEDGLLISELRIPELPETVQEREQGIPDAVVNRLAALLDQRNPQR